MAPRWRPGAYDADGKEFIGALGARHLQLYDSSGEQWDTRGAGFYGIGRDGLQYDDGQPTIASASFGTVAGGIDRRSWGSDQDPLSLGGSSQYTLSIPVDGTLRVWSVTNADGGSKFVNSAYKWYMVGDYDITYTVTILGYNIYCPAGQLCVVIDGSDYAYVEFQRTTLSPYIAVNGGSTTGTGVTIGASFTARLTRVGTTMEIYVNGVLKHTRTHAGLSGPAYPQVAIYDIANGYRGYLRFDVSLTASSWTTVTSGGWPREPAGTYRGARGDFPTKALIVCSDGGSGSNGSMDIIDTDNAKLWASSRPGNWYQLGGYIYSAVWPVMAKMEEGAMVLPTSPGGTSGNLRMKWLDFTVDDERLVGVSAIGDIVYNTAGALMGGYNFEGGYDLPSQRGSSLPSGRWRARNSTVDRGGIGGGSAAWQTRSNNVYFGDIMSRETFLYWAMALSGGLDIQQWKRWYIYSTPPANYGVPTSGTGLFRAISAETSRMLWTAFERTTGDVYYGSYTTIYRATFAAWQAALAANTTPGTFSASESKALPGTRPEINFTGGAWIAGDRGLWYPVFLDAHTLAVAANEGIYTVDWPSGSWTLMYGKTGSGAVHELSTMTYASVDALAVKTVGSTICLICSCTEGSVYWIYVIATSNNELLAKSDVTATMTAKVVSLVA